MIYPTLSPGLATAHTKLPTYVLGLLNHVPGLHRHRRSEPPEFAPEGMQAVVHASRLYCTCTTAEQSGARSSRLSNVVTSPFCSRG